MSQALVIRPGRWTLEPFTAPLPNDRIRVRVAVAGLCRTDIQAMTGAIELPEGRILGHEASGWIEHIPESQAQAASMLDLEPGDAVAFFPFLPCGKCPTCLAPRAPIEQCHAPRSLGLDVDGAFAPFVDLPPEVIFKGPRGLSLRHLAYAEPVSAAMAVVDVPVLMQSERVAVMGTGRIAQLTIAVLNAYRGTPVDHLVPGEDWAGGYDAIVETRARGDLLARAVASLRHGGTLVVKSRPSELVEWPHRDIVLRRLNVLGAPYGSFQDGLDAMASGKLDVQAMLGEVFEWSEAGIRHALDIEAGGDETCGKLFFEINQSGG